MPMAPLPFTRVELWTGSNGRRETSDDPAAHRLQVLPGAHHRRYDQQADLVACAFIRSLCARRMWMI